VSDLAANRPGERQRLRAEAQRVATPIFSAVASELGRYTQAEALEAGATGEEQTEAALAHLPSAWKVIHSVAADDDSADIDHLLIGPQGVFSVNTKNHGTKHVVVAGERFTVNGYAQDYFEESRMEAREVARILSAGSKQWVLVTPLIVLASNPSLRMSRTPSDVHILRVRELCRFVVARREKLSTDAIHFLHEVARESETWRLLYRDS
jgi:hypothetical protein